jgi:glycosyltransferase involved in cell wall biosynthesis
MEIVVELPLVSIVTPSYQQAEFLEETILSVLGQDYPHLEYLVIDGGSEDGSLEIIKKYQDQIDYWVSEEDQGQTDAINKGFAAARGQILAWINSDDTYQPGAVSEAVDYLQNHSRVGMVYGDLNYIDEAGRVIGQFNAKQASLARLRRGAVHIPQPSAFWRAQLWEEVGPLDPEYYFAMDYDLWLRFAEISTLKYLPGHTWANFRIHGRSKTIAADQRCWEEMLQIHLRDGGSHFSILAAKYALRKFLGPLWTAYKKSTLLK